MKLKNLNPTLLLLIAISITTFQHSVAQVPQSFNYQAVARDVNGALLANQNICVQSTITNGSGGPVLYAETFNISTNQFGLFTLGIGSGTIVSGIFSTLSWAAITPWHKVEIKIGCTGSYIDMGTARLLSVPYALNAASTASVSGTANYVAKFSSPNTIGNAQLFDDGSNVGIGTATPTLAKLMVQGSVGNTVAMFGGVANSQGVSFVTDWPGLYFNCYYNAAIKAMSATGYPSIINTDQANGALTLGTSDVANTVVGGNVTVTERMRVTGNGRVGIGTTAPVAYARTQSEAGARAVGLMGSSATNTNISFGTAITAMAAGFIPEVIGVYGKTSGVQNGYSMGVVGENLSTNIEVYGVVGSTPGSGIQEAQGNNHYAVYGFSNNALTSDYGVYGRAIGPAANYAIYGTINVGANNYAGYFNGKVYAVGTITSSDAKLKKDIEPLTGALALTMKLKPSTYFYKTNEYKSMNLPAEKQFGLIAQEVEQVIPSIVSENNHPAENRPGEEPSPEIHFKGLNYTALVPVLIAAVKELNVKNEALEKSNTDLLKRLEALEKK